MNGAWPIVSADWMLVKNINYNIIMFKMPSPQRMCFFSWKQQELFKISGGGTTLDFILERLLAAEEDRGED